MVDFAPMLGANQDTFVTCGNGRPIQWDLIQIYASPFRPLG